MLARLVASASVRTLHPVSLTALPAVRRLCADSHDDFKPQRKPVSSDAPGDVQERIAQDVASAPLVVYMKGMPQQPMCGFSNRVIQILNAEGVDDFKSFNVLADDSIREGIKKFSSWPTIPQVYIKGEFVGGSDVLLEMYQSGELTTKLKEAGVSLRGQQQ